MGEYILLVDDEIDILDTYEMYLEAICDYKILTATSGNKAIEVIKSQGCAPVLTISDYRMSDGDGVVVWDYLKINYPNSPFVISSGNPPDQMQSLFPDIFGYIAKPNIMEPLEGLIKKITNTKSPKFYAIKLSTLKRIGFTNFELYIKLEENNFVKAVHANESFNDEDISRFVNKGLTHLYLADKDAKSFQLSFEKMLLTKMQGSENADLPLIDLLMQMTSKLKMLADIFGWTQETVDTAQKVLKEALLITDTDESLRTHLQKRITRTESKFVDHMAYLNLFNSVLAFRLGWVSDSTHLKLAMATLLHDMFVDEDCYDSIPTLNKKVTQNSNLNDQEKKYREHPIMAYEQILKFKYLPPDVDQIVLQHHEQPNGAGFPKALNYSRITPLASLFIIASALTDSILEATDPKEEALNFIKNSETLYNQGQFKKIFEVLREEFL